MPDRTVLVVEDFDDTRTMIRMLLEMKGCHVLEAANGREAVEAASAHCSEIDLILMDLTMPVLDGYEATRRILAHPETHDIPVVAVSAHCDAEHAREALAAGCRACVGKPVNFDLLTELIGRYARGS